MKEDYSNTTFQNSLYQCISSHYELYLNRAAIIFATHYSLFANLCLMDQTDTFKK